MGEVKVMKFGIVCPLKTLIFGRSKHLNVVPTFKILANTFSDSLAILKNKVLSYRFPSRSYTCVSVMEMTVPVPSQKLKKGEIQKESHEFLGSKRDDRFSNPFFEMVPKTCHGSFFVPALA